MNSTIQSTTDVLIIGAGPSGLIAALWIAKCGIDTHIIDVNAEKSHGRADGVQPRTAKILASFGFANDILGTAFPIHESSYWGDDSEGGIKHAIRVSECFPELSRFPLMVMSQGRTEQFMMDRMKKFNDLEVERRVVAINLELDNSLINEADTFPVSVTVHHLTDEELQEAGNRTRPQPGGIGGGDKDHAYIRRRSSRKEGLDKIIKAKYIIGADSVRSFMRKKLGIDMVGEPLESVRAALDGEAYTDFHKLNRCIILKENKALMVIPRESGMIRLGVFFGDIDRASVTPEMILEQFRHLIRPYKVDFKAYSWHGVFQSAQRSATELSRANRIFLVGDALYTYSPRAGIGLNFSMQDAYNLGWKISHIVKGLAKTSILATYNEERGLTCRQLVEFDKKLSKDFMSGAASGLQTVRNQLIQGFPFTTGTAIEYSNGLLVAKEISKQYLAPSAVLGRRLPTKWVVGHGSGGPVDLETRLPSDGRYKLVLFTGDVSDEKSLNRVRRLAQALERPESFVQRIRKRHLEPSSLLNVLILHTASREKIEISDLPLLLTNTLYSDQVLENVFVDNSETNAFQECNAYSGYGVKRTSGCMILLRPDRHVMYIGEIEDVDTLEQLMSGILA